MELQPTEQQNEIIQLANQNSNEAQSLKATTPSVIKSDEQKDHQQVVKGSTVLEATVNMVKSGLGTGILFYPSVFKSCGIILSIIMMILFGLSCYFCWLILSKVICFQESLNRKDPNNQNLTLERAAGILFNKKVKIFLEVITMIYAYGTAIGYCIFVKDSTKDLAGEPIYVILVMFAIYLPLSLYKHIQKLVIFNYLGLTALFIAIGTIIVKSIIAMNDYGSNFPTYKFFEFSQIPLQFGVFSFAYDINGVITEIHASMEEKSKFPTVLRRYLFVSCTLGIIVGTLGYLAFGEETNDIIFVNFGSMNGYGDVISVLYGIALTAGILMFCFPIGYHLDNFIKVFVLKKHTEETNIIQMILTRTAIFFSFGILSIYISGISSIFNLLGCVFCTVLTFTTPFLLLKRAQIKELILISLSTKETSSDKEAQNIYQNIQEEKCTQKTLPRGKTLDIICLIVFLFGLVGGISGIVSTIIQLQQEYS
ncbi:hypothetical protein ABPG74_017189 [Tetrahymena malaccensis]